MILLTKTSEKDFELKNGVLMEILILIVLHVIDNKLVKKIYLEL